MSDSDLLLVGIVIFTETIIKTMNSFAGVYVFLHLKKCGDQGISAALQYLIYKGCSSVTFLPVTKIIVNIFVRAYLTWHHDVFLDQNN